MAPLAKARELALANRMLARSGGDLLSEKRRAEGVPTFTEAAERVLEQKRGGWRGRWHAQNWWRSMERYAFPRIGNRPVSEVNTADVLDILTPIWHVKAPAGASPTQGRGRGDRDGAGGVRATRRQAGVRVSRADSDAVWRGTRRTTG